ncbi:MAG: phage shock protein operon transcriptional activator [Desulfobulbaceae bacterium]|nr:MAG: phage shock protein operon transcriptional activator [Desulfobulbaceae bacterium]
MEALGHSESFLEFQDKLSQVAPVDRPVLLIGERGTGKELAAQRLHFLSRRWERPFVTLNCSTLSPSLIESELFGHEKGAFTGAEGQKRGRFEAANGGTLFLDEIGTIPLVAQEKILRFVEYGTFERVGSSQSTEVNVRIVCATNIDLQAKVERGEFKADLLDRLSFEVLFLPPLRYRQEDIMLLARHFAARMAYELEIDDPIAFSADAEHALEQHPWYGNIRELKNVIERAVYQSGDSRVNRIVFDPFQSPYNPGFKPEPKKKPVKEPEPAAEVVLPHGVDFKSAVDSYEIRLLRGELEKNRFNQRQAARALGLTYNQFRGLYRKYRSHLD